MSAEDRLALALSEWQRQHQIADGDPLLALLDQPIHGAHRRTAELQSIGSASEPRSRGNGCFHVRLRPPLRSGRLEMKEGLGIVGALWVVALTLLFTTRRSFKSRVIVRLAGFTWSRADFCRVWLITGDTGSGKTRSGITPLLFQIFQNEPTWGGLCIDDKGLYWETLSAMAKHFGREDDLILLQVRPEGMIAT